MTAPVRPAPVRPAPSDRVKPSDINAPGGLLRELAPGQGFRGDQVPDKPTITAPYKHAALAARLDKAAKLNAQRQKDFHTANLFRRAPRRV